MRLCAGHPQKNDLVLDAGVEVNGYPRFSFNGNAGTEITVTYLERFGNGADGARIDDMGGTVEGRADHIILMVISSTMSRSGCVPSATLSSNHPTVSCRKCPRRRFIENRLSSVCGIHG